MWYVQIKNWRSWHPVPLLHGKYMEKQWKHWRALFCWAPKSLEIVAAVVKIKRHWSLGDKAMKNLDNILKSRDFISKGLYIQSCGFARSCDWMWELDYKESWAPKNWCFWTVVLDTTLESPSNVKEMQPVHDKGNMSWIFIGRTNAKAEPPILWPPDVKNWLIRKYLNAGEY